MQQAADQRPAGESDPGVPRPELLVCALPAELGPFAEDLEQVGEHDWAGELGGRPWHAAVIGVGGRRISEADALAHVAGYSVFNDGSIRDYQMRTTQWTLGKNFIGTGVLGPALVTPDELPEGASGLRLTTRVGEELLQEGNTGSMVFGVAKAIALLSEVFAFEPGDVIAFGTPSGIGGARKPPRWLLPGERIRVAVEQIGELSNPIVDEAESK